MKPCRFLQTFLLLLTASFALQTHAWTRSPAVTFATLPAGTAHPEGITADLQGNIYVADFDVSKSSGPGNVIVFDAAGKLLRKFDVSSSSPLLLGIAYRPQTNDLLVIDFGNGNVLKMDPVSGASTVFAAIPGAAGPHALAFDASGNVYIFKLPGLQTVDSQWASEVTRHTIARIRAQIPPVRGLSGR